MSRPPAAGRGADIVSADAVLHGAGDLACIGGDDQLTVLPLLDRELIRAHPKPFFGTSDNINLLMLLRNPGIVGYHGAA